MRDQLSDEEFYIEHINRFVVEYHEELPAEHKAAMRLNGIDPDNHWNLKWSFEDEAAAQRCCEEDQKHHNAMCEEHGWANHVTYRMRDLGQPVEIKRKAWF